MYHHLDSILYGQKGKKLVITADGSICEFTVNHSAKIDPDCINIADSNGNQTEDCSMRINTFSGHAAFGIFTNLSISAKFPVHKERKKGERKRNSYYFN